MELPKYIKNKIKQQNERYGKNMKNTNNIDSVQHISLTKKDIIELIENTFPDEEVGNYGQVAQLTITEMTDGTKMQSICFGKIFKA